MKKSLLLSLSLALVALFTLSCNKKAFVTIGTGGVTGVYYPTGGAISRMLNKKSAEYKIKATVQSTGGSVYNINAVMAGQLDFGIAQSDRQYLAYMGKAQWKGKAQKDLRSVFSIYPEIVTLVATDKSGIKTIKDMKGKHINLGNPGSGQLTNSLDIMKALGWKETDIKAEKAKAVEAPGLLQDERIDGFFYTVGHPNGSMKEASSGRIKVRFVAIDGPEMDALIKKLPYYAKAMIPVKFYPNSLSKTDVPSIGVKATLITSAKTSEKAVYALTKEVFENFEAFKKLHPAYSNITKESMFKGLTAPIHKGALKYFKEAGLMKYIDKRLIAQ